jgi:aspartate kinase
MENQGMTGKMAVGGITQIDDLVLVRVLGAKRGYGLAGQALSSLGLNGINITCVTSFVDREDLNNIGFAIKEDDLDQALGILQSLKDELEARSIEYQRRCSSISIYGPHFSERPAIAGTVFAATGEAGVEIHMIATSFSTVSFLTNEKDADAAVAQLGECFLVP